MTATQTPLYDFLTITPPFDRLPADTLELLADKAQLLRYRMGQAIVVRETMPAQIAILYEGQARLLGLSRHTGKKVQHGLESLIQIELQSLCCSEAQYRDCCWGGN